MDHCSHLINWDKRFIFNDSLYLHRISDDGEDKSDPRLLRSLEAVEEVM